MKKLLLLTALMLGGCGTTGTVSPENLTQTAKQIQTYTRTICAFVPTIATIATIISQGAIPVTQIAQDICAAVTTAPLADGPNPQQRSVAQVSGVVISGRFVRR